MEEVVRRRGIGSRSGSASPRIPAHGGSDPLEAVFADRDDASTLRMHFHNRDEIILIERGASQYAIEGEKYAASAGTLVVISRLERHEVRILERPYVRRFLLVDSGFYLDAVHDPILGALFRNRPAGYRHAVPLEPEAYERVRDAFDRLRLETQRHDRHRTRVLAAMLELLAVEMHRASPEIFSAAPSRRGEDRIAGIQSLIEARFKDGSLDRKTLAEAAYCSEDHLSRAFRKATGYTVLQYAQRLRLAHAKDLLMRTDLPVAQVGRDSGFGDTNHFIRTFREATGLPPLQYRKKAAKSG